MSTPPWERSLAQMVALHDLAVAAMEIGGDHARVESARRQVVVAIDLAAEAGASEVEVDRALARIRADP